MASQAYLIVGTNLWLIDLTDTDNTSDPFGDLGSLASNLTSPSLIGVETSGDLLVFTTAPRSTLESKSL